VRSTHLFMLILSLGVFLLVGGVALVPRAVVAASSTPSAEPVSSPSPGPPSLVLPMPCPRAQAAQSVYLARVYPASSTLPLHRVVRASKTVGRLYAAICGLTPVAPELLRCNPSRNGSTYEMTFYRRSRHLLSVNIVLNRCRFASARPFRAPSVSFYVLPQRVQAMVAAILGVRLSDLVR
jgi:hypothetical protein